ncbi:multidrug resistance efflux pump [Acidovorax sp. 56]|uniref:HlyD family efflux transporter periplasmic adaptor subunit n=1 Tax=Acidovorax sp. 56 TaxID=2035205 RepID=UPI000C434FF3|nr:HlyD family secretion protein [Acidovorax sp. 56]PIF29014.1 multidrug resistance efflux pump [Acidovorax sp. 56]
MRYAASKRQVPRWRWYLLLAMVLTPPAYLMGRFAVSYWWETTPGLVVTEQVVVRAPVAGQVARIADVGERLRAGQALMDLEQEPSALPDVATPANRQPPVQPIAEPFAPNQPLAIRLAMQEETQRLTLQQLALQQEKLKALQALRTEGAATRNEVDNAQAVVLQTQAEASRARAAASESRSLLAQAGAATLLPAPTTATPSRSDKTQPTRTPTLKAPFDAIVVRQLVRSGEHVEAGADVAVVQGTTKSPLVHAYLPPGQARYAQPGRLATLHFMDGRSLRAEVLDVVAEAERTPAERVSPLTPRMPSIVVRLKPQADLPPGYRIHYLPLDVRFDWVWGGWW